MSDKTYNWAPSPHTADLAISISASDHAGLFMAAMEGLIGILELSSAEPEPNQITDYTLTQKSDSIENSLVDFLNECIFLMEVEELIPFELSMIEISDDVLRAAMRCRMVMPGDRPYVGHIKAATYSDLEVTEAGGIYYARIIFDT